MRVLVAEDNDKMASLLERGLVESGYAVDVVSTGQEAVWMGRETDYDAVVLDVGLDDIDGFEVCRALRSSGRWAPLLMLTARDGIDDRVRGLDAGADDYLTKPFSFAELVARLRALIRRGGGPRPAVLQVGDLALDAAARSVTLNGEAIALTPKEFALLEYLMRHAGEVVSRARLLEHAWDFAFDGDPHVLTVYIGYLRAKIERPPVRPLLHTVRGVGYRLGG